MTQVVNIEGLTRAAEKYDREFKVLPYAVLIPELANLGIRLIQVNYKDTIIEELRKGGITKPYAQDEDIIYSKIAKLTERSLITHPGYAAIKDHIRNYREKNVLFDPTANKVDNQGKKHPLEKMVIINKVRTVSEDILDALFPATRNIADKSPMGLVDGIDTLIDNSIASGEISIAEKNMINSGSFSAPASETDTDAWDALVAWLRSVHVKFALNGTPVLRLPIAIYYHCADALANKLRYKGVEFEDFVRHLQDRANMPKLKVVKHFAIGTGARITLQVEGNIDLGMNTMGDEQFVQVRNIFEDPNLVQFWLQFDVGLRINSMHPYKFVVNEGSPVANPVSGDYTDSGSGSESVSV
jgi:hypothetical protein